MAATPKAAQCAVCGDGLRRLRSPLAPFSAMWTAITRVASRVLTDQTIRLVVKRYCEAAGMDSKAFAAHSLRAGLATWAAIGGASERSIMNQTGHRSVQMVRRYIRDGSLFRDNAAAKLGL